MVQVPAEGSRSAPYPISVTLLKAGVPTPRAGSIVKLTQIGFIMKVESARLYLVGENLELSFVLPSVGKHIHCQGKVIKTYESYDPANPGKPVAASHAIEIHFRNLGEEGEQAIVDCLVKTGQAKLR